MINFMNLLRRTEEEIFPSNVKKRKEERECQATDLGLFYTFERPAFLNKITSNKQATTLSLR
jgi:hypothetical protein